MIHYRSDIDGLRAIAVLAVLFFHAEFEFASGGFVGVDIFFVISGYLLTKIFLTEIKTDTFSIRGFYERRARRILPALIVVLLVTIPISWALMTPDELENFGQSVFASVFFSNNILLMLTTGYFDSAVELKPLMHTWSLGVEEQFYLLFPFMFLLMHRLRSSWLIFLLIFASLIAAEWASAVSAQGHFYSPLGRVWELLSGSLVAYSRVDERFSGEGVLQNLAVFFGLVLILGSIAVFDAYTPFPSLWTLTPVIGAVLVILFGSNRNLFSKIISFQFFVWVGLISYGTYLWHQPLFAFWRIWNISIPSTMEYIILIAISLVLGFLSYRIIEKPFRSKKFISSKNFIFLIASFMVLVAGSGLLMHFNKGYPDRLKPEARALLDVPKSNWSLLNKNCIQPIEQFEEIKVCYLNGDEENNIDIVLYGDSHAEALAQAIRDYAVNQNHTAVFLKNKHCHIISEFFGDGADDESREKCLASRMAIGNWFKDNHSVAESIINIRWTMQSYPLEGSGEPPFFDNQEGGVEAHPGVQLFAFDHEGKLSARTSDKASSLAKFIQQFDRFSDKTVVIGPVPEIGWDVRDFTYRTLLRTGKVPEKISTSLERYLDRNQFSISVLKKIAEASEKITYVDPASIFCSFPAYPNRCIAMLDDEFYYFDDDHLSLLGSQMLIDRLSLAK